jgi:hypothetical protein
VRDVEDSDGVSEQPVLELVVYRGGCTETWTVIYLKEPWFASFIQEDVEAKNLETQ